MNFRTDLAIERQEYREKQTLDGVLSHKQRVKGIEITTIEIINDRGERLLKKPRGKYITLETKKLNMSSEVFSDTCQVLSQQLKGLIPLEGTVLVAGLGNEGITPDALGPRSLDKLLATRHISPPLAESLGLGELRSVAGIVPGVLGKTGMETAETIQGVVKKIKPCCVIVVDALASRSVRRLGTTVQLADSGIAPGSGVGNRRRGIDKESLGVPVIAIGVPTVVDALTMAMDVFEKAGMDTENCDAFRGLCDHGSMMVTPKEIDALIDRAAALIAMGINLALQKNLTATEIAEIVG